MVLPQVLTRFRLGFSMTYTQPLGPILLVHLIQIQGSEGDAHVVQLLLGFDAKGAFGERKPQHLAW